MGVDSATGAMAAWCQGHAVEVRMATVLSGLYMGENVASWGDIELVPLALSTAELPRLPMFRGDSASDYLGLTLVRLALRASPGIFRPHADGNASTVRSRSGNRINLDLVRDALSLMTNRSVALSRVWLEYPSAWGYCVSGPTSTYGTDRPKPRPWRKMTSGSGATVITPRNDAITDSVCPREVHSTIGALQRADKKLRIAVDRWRRSMVEDSELADRFIDLRIAIEAIYLQDFTNERSQEMRFRLALAARGIWGRTSRRGARFVRRCVKRTTRRRKPCTRGSCRRQRSRPCRRRRISAGWAY